MAIAIPDINLLKHPIETNLLVVVFDMTHFSKYSRKYPSMNIFNKMVKFNETSSKFVKEHGGLILKFIGDAGLAIFPEDNASESIVAMAKFKAEMDRWLEKNLPGSHLAVNCHIGPVTVGPAAGFNGQSQIDIFGETVNICFTMSQRGFVISPQAFRSLSAEARKQFKKFTPPIIYHLTSPHGEVEP